MCALHSDNHYGADRTFGQGVQHSARSGLGNHYQSLTRPVRSHPRKHSVSNKWWNIGWKQTFVMFIPFSYHFVALVKVQLSMDLRSAFQSKWSPKFVTGVVSEGFLILAEQDIPYCQSLNAAQPPSRHLRCPRQRQITGPLLPLAQDQAKPTKELSAVQAEDSIGMLCAYCVKMMMMMQTLWRKE